jgi:hemerythrin-like domain-containing protein
VKRHPAFQDLSRDHYLVLNRALQVVRAVEGHPSARPYELAVFQLQDLWEHDGLKAHFAEEEADLVPALQARGAGAAAEQMLAEHAALRAGLEALGGATRDQAAATARSLMAHARWEEEAVFGWLQEHLSDGELADRLARSRHFRAANGLPVGEPRP